MYANSGILWQLVLRLLALHAVHSFTQVAKQQGEYLAGLLGSGACKPGQPMNGAKAFRCGRPLPALRICVFSSAMLYNEPRRLSFCIYGCSAYPGAYAG